MWVAGVLLVLFGAASLDSLGTASGLHNLRYDVTVISLGGSVQPQFLAEGYLDAKPFLHFDSEKGKAQPQGPWADADLRNKTWDTETIDLTDIGMELRRTLAEIMALQDQQEGLHSFQEMLGCEIQENNLARGFWYFFYDGEPFLSYHLETQRWMVLQSFAQPLALEIKNTWDTDRDKHKEYKHRVQGDICGKLQKYLKSSTSVKSQTVPPAVNITRREVVEGNVMLLCRIFGFYPWKISLTWLQDGGPLAQDSQYHGCIVPHVNGTYQTWVSIKVPQREEQRYSCHVEHSGKNYTYPEAFGGMSVQKTSWPIILTIVAAIITISALIFWWCKKKKKTLDVESPEQVILQGLDGAVMPHSWSQSSPAPECTGSPWASID